MSYQNTNRPIAAFSMADYESLTGRAEFGRGKDKTKRKKRGLGFYAGVGAAGVAGAGALGAAARYGLAGAKESRLGDTRYYKGGTQVPDTVYGGMKTSGATPVKAGSLEDRARKFGSGAKSQVSRDIDSLKALGGRVRQGATNLKTQVQMGAKNARYYAGQGVNATKASGSRALSAAKGNAGLVNKVKGIYSSGKVGKAGLAGAGLLGAAALGGAAYGASKLLSNRKKKRS